MSDFSIASLAPSWAESVRILKGDVPGHEFHGNQYASMVAGHSTRTAERANDVEFQKAGVLNPKGIQDHANLHRSIAADHMVDGLALLDMADKKGVSPMTKAYLNHASELHNQAAAAHKDAANKWEDGADNQSYGSELNASKASTEAVAASRNANAVTQYATGQVQVPSHLNP